MYPVSRDYARKIQELTRVFTIELRVQYTDDLGVKKTIILDDSDISNNSFKHEEATQSSDEFTVGGVFGANISFTIINQDKFKDVNFMEATVVPTIGLLMGNDVTIYENWMDLRDYTWETMTNRAWGELIKEVEDDTNIIEYVRLGKFNIDTVDEHRTTTEIRAIDDMIKLDKSFNMSNITFPTTLQQIFLNVCNTGGVSYSTTTFPNSNYTVEKRPEGSYTLRDILSYVAEASGTYARFDRLGSLELGWYNDESVTVTPDNRFNLVAKKYEMQITGVSKTLKGEAEDEDGEKIDEVYLAGDEGYVIDLSDNPLLQDDFQIALRTIHDNIKDTKFTPYDATWQGNPAIQAGDKITHVSVGRELENGIIEDGEVYNTIVTHSTYTYRGSGEMSAKGMTNTDRDMSGSIVNKIRDEINADIGRETSRLDEERKKAGQLIANMLGGHLIVELDSIYIADSPDLETATKVWKWGIGGFGFFPNGIYDEDGNVNEPITAITLEGSIVAELVAAGIISADYIETGKLSSFGGETWIDLDTGFFKMGGLIQDEKGFRIEYGGTDLEEELDDIRDSIKDNEPTYMWIKYSNKFDGGALDGSEMSDNGNGMSYIGIANNKGVPLPSIDPRDYRWSKFKGEDGDGRGIVEINEWYLATDLSSGINNQSSGWSKEIIGYDETNKYLWNYEEIIFTDGTDQKTVPRVIGVWGEDGVGIENVTEFYLASPLNYGITNKSHGFSTTPKQIDEVNPYLWNYTRTKYTNGDVIDSDAILIGTFGKDGEDGKDGYNGESSLVGILSNEYHLFTKDIDGNIDTYSGANTEFKIYEGTMDVTDSWNISVEKTENLNGNLIGNIYTITKITGAIGSVTLIGKRTGYPDVRKTFNFSTARHGTDSTSYWMVVTPKTIKVDSKGRYEPTTITMTSMKQVGENEPELFPCMFNIEEAKASGGYVKKHNTPYDDMVSEYTWTPNKDVKSVKITAHLGHRKFLDIETVTMLSDGADGYTPVKGSDYFDGKDGQDGVSQVVWVRYSKYPDGGREDGSQFYVDPLDNDGEPREYIGIGTSTNGISPKNPNSYTWSKFIATDGVKGEAGEDGKSKYIHIKYSNDNGRTFTGNEGEDVGAWMGVYVDEIKEDKLDVTLYTWNRVKGEDGKDGSDGEDGVSEHIHIMYSDYPNGLNMSEDPDNKAFMGIAHTESPYRPVENFDYDWTRIQGTDGVKGTDGTNNYIHIKYSNDGGGSFTENNGEALGDWIGIYVDDKEEDSRYLYMYDWKLVKGEKGKDGINGVSITSVDVQYRLSDSRTYLTGNYSWNTNAPTWEKGKYIWSRTKATYSAGSPTYTDAALITGNDGSNGLNGRGITKITEQYYLSQYSTRLYNGSWQSNPPPWKPGWYMWTRSIITFDDGTSGTTNEVVDRAWETINGIDDKVEIVKFNVDTLNNQIVSKVSKGDLGSEFVQKPGSISLDAKNINFTGAVNVLSDITNGLGVITAGELRGRGVGNNSGTGIDIDLTSNTFTGWQSNYRALEIQNNKMDFFDRQGSGHSRPVGTLFSSRAAGQTNRVGLTINSEKNSALSMGYAHTTSATTAYSDYIRLNKDGHGVLESPIAFKEEVSSSESINIRGDSRLNLGGGSSLYETDTRLIIRGTNSNGFQLGGASQGQIIDWSPHDNIPVAIRKNTKVFGDLTSSKGKYCVEETKNYGERLISAYETTEYYYGDIGSGIINDNGECLVHIDDIFQETTNTNITYHIFTQKYNGEIGDIERYPNYFIVKGVPNTEFSWELKAKRKGYENDRMETSNNYLNDNDDVSSIANDDFEILTTSTNEDEEFNNILNRVLDESVLDLLL